MDIPNDLISAARLQWRDDGSPYSLDYADIYYSESQALTESSYVFLQGNDLEQRWQQLSGNDFCIGELGFGGGLNFLNSCRLWTSVAPEDACLHYLACELHPFLDSDLERLYRFFPELEIYSSQLLRVYPPLCAGIHQRILQFGKHRIKLSLLLGDASKMLNAVMQPHGFRVDAWFLDGFSPKSNPALWQDSLCKTLADLSHPGTTLSTYSAAALVKHSLQNNGFRLTRIKGFGRKRHMLKALFQPGSNTASSHVDAFTLPAAPAVLNKTALVIGAGLAGCSTAYALAKDGWQVTVVERNEQVASQASGNKRGIVSCRLSVNRDASNDFYLHAYFHALAHYASLADRHNFDWLQSGHLHLAGNEAELNRQYKIHSMSCLSGYTQLFDAQSASELAGMNLNRGGLYFPAGATLNPALLCEAYLQHEGVRLLLHTDIITLRFTQEQWRVLGHQGEIARADILVIANSLDAIAFQQTQHYPLRSNYGQVDEYLVPEGIRMTECSLSGKTYLIPLDTQSLLLGGLTLPDSEARPDQQAGRQMNLELLNHVSSDLAARLSTQHPVHSRMGMRCSSPDYLPLVGPVEQCQACEEIFQPLQRNARQTITREAVLYPGLFINVAHGAHGLSSTPLSAAYLSALVSGQVLPLTNSLCSKLHPLRFLLRDLKRQKR